MFLSRRQKEPWNGGIVSCQTVNTLLNFRVPIESISLLGPTLVECREHSKGKSVPRERLELKAKFS